MEVAFAVALFLIPPLLTAWMVFGRKRVPSAAVVADSAALDNRFWPLFFNAFRLRCPVCKRGRIFKGWFATEDHCPACGIELAKESGYYIGSVYFNYGLTGAIEIVTYIGCRFGLGVPDKYLLPPLVAFGAIFPLYFFRYARSSWLVFDQYFQPRFPPNGPADRPQTGSEH